MTTNTPHSKRKRALQNSPGENSTICLVCLDRIIDATDDTDGQEAIFCEGTCNSWIHLQCAGLSQTLFKILQESEVPFYCPHCRLITQDKQLQEFKTMVENLLKEVVLLNAAVSENQTIQSSTSQHQFQQETQTITNNFKHTLSTQIQPSTTTKVMNRANEGDCKFQGRRK